MIVTQEKHLVDDCARQDRVSSSSEGDDGFKSHPRRILTDSLGSFPLGDIMSIGLPEGKPAKFEPKA
jgi:hypothetical protein